MRLTNSKRDLIISEETTKRFHDKLLVAEKVYKDEIEKEVKKTIPNKITQDLVDGGWIRVEDDVKIEGLDKIDGFYYCKQIGNYYPIRKNTYNHEIKPTKALEKKIMAYVKLVEEESQFMKKLRSALYCFTTAKQAVENIPELAEHFKDEQRAKAVIPVEEIKAVRKMLKRKNKEK